MGWISLTYIGMYVKEVMSDLTLEKSKLHEEEKPAMLL